MAESRYLAGIPKPPLKQRTKTLVLWVILVLLFLAIWQLVSPAPGERRRAPAREEEPLSPLESAGLALGGFVAFSGLIFALSRRRMFPPPDPLLDAESSLLHEDYEAAIQKTR